MSNLALGKPARQSSNYESDPKYCKPEHGNIRPASNAVDGDCEDDHTGHPDEGGSPNGHFSTHTLNDPDAWWDVDLGEDAIITQVRLHPTHHPPCPRAHSRAHVM